MIFNKGVNIITHYGSVHQNDNEIPFTPSRMVITLNTEKLQVLRRITSVEKFEPSYNGGRNIK